MTKSEQKRFDKALICAVGVIVLPVLVVFLALELSLIVSLIVNFVLLVIAFYSYFGVDDHDRELRELRNQIWALERKLGYSDKTPKSIIEKEPHALGTEGKLFAKPVQKIESVRESGHLVTFKRPITHQQFTIPSTTPLKQKREWILQDAYRYGAFVFIGLFIVWLILFILLINRMRELLDYGRNEILFVFLAVGVFFFLGGIFSTLLWYLENRKTLQHMSAKSKNDKLQ